MAAARHLLDRLYDVLDGVFLEYKAAHAEIQRAVDHLLPPCAW